MTSTLLSKSSSIVYRLTFWASYSYLALVLALWGLIFFASDRWWLATAVLYGPRWLMLIPGVLMIPFVVFFARHLLIPLLFSILIVAWPIMGLTLHLKKSQHTHNAAILRVLSYNIHGGKINNDQLTNFIKDSSVDLVALQEYPHDKKLSMPKGWYGYQDHGLAVYSRYPMQFVKLVQVLQPNEKWPGTHLLHVTVTTPQGPLAFCSLQLPSPRFGLLAIADKYTLLRPARKKLLEKQTRERWFASQQVANYLDNLKMPVFVVGDFNTTTDSRLYKDVWGKYSNAFNQTGLGYGWTQRVSVKGIPFGARIDHILTNNKLSPLLCSIGPDMGSDHLPVIADICFNQ